jgi:hypothetical protein
LIEEHFQQYSGFTMTRRIVNGMERVKANFTIEGWPIQIFGQNKGMKTEPAFASLLKLEGGPYAELLALSNWTDEELRETFIDRLVWNSV